MGFSLTTLPEAYSTWLTLHLSSWGLALEGWEEEEEAIKSDFTFSQSRRYTDLCFISTDTPQIYAPSNPPPSFRNHKCKLWPVRFSFEFEFPVSCTFWWSFISHVAVTVLEKDWKEIASENLVRHDDIKKSMNFRELIKANFISVFGYVTFVGKTPYSTVLLLKSFSVRKEFSMLPPIFNFQTPQKYPFRLKWGGRYSKWAMFSFYFKATKVFYQLHEISWQN